MRWLRLIKANNKTVRKHELEHFLSWPERVIQAIVPLALGFVLECSFKWLNLSRWELDCVRIGHSIYREIAIITLVPSKRNVSASPQKKSFIRTPTRNVRIQTTCSKVSMLCWDENSLGTWSRLATVKQFDEPTWGPIHRIRCMQMIESAIEPSVQIKPIAS